VTPPEHTPLDDLRDAVAELQRERVESRDHRTRVQTLLTLAGAAAIAVVLGAVTVRDTVLRQESAAVALTARVVALEAASGRRETDDRVTSAAIVRLQTTLETLQSTIAHRLDVIDQRLQPAPPR
jgi:hypothetical protein